MTPFEAMYATDWRELSLPYSVLSQPLSRPFGIALFEYNRWDKM